MIWRCEMPTCSKFGPLMAMDVSLTEQCAECANPITFREEGWIVKPEAKHIIKARKQKEKYNASFNYNKD